MMSEDFPMILYPQVLLVSQLKPRLGTQKGYSIPCPAQSSTRPSATSLVNEEGKIGESRALFQRIGDSLHM